MPNNLEMWFSEMFILKIPRRWGEGVMVDINNANISYEAISYFRVFLHTTIYYSGKMEMSLLAHIAYMMILRIKHFPISNIDLKHFISFRSEPQNECEHRKQ